MANKILQRVSLVVFVDGDELLATQIQGAIIAFAETNFKGKIAKTEKHLKPIYIKNYVER